MGRMLLVFLVLVIAALVVYVGFLGPKPDVVVYCALDDVHADPLIREFERKTGLDVDPRYDVEAVKTVGLFGALVEEKSNPKCDVFWNNEIIHTIKLKKAGVLAPYESPSAADIPAKWKDPEHYWTGFAARARVLILNEEAAAKIEPDESKWPARTTDMLDPKWKGQCGLAKPLAGTTLTHMSTLWAYQGPDFVKSFYAGLRENDWVEPPGNAQVMRSVADGVFAWGFTDTDDYQKAENDGKPVRRIFPDQEPGGEIEGCLVIPNTVCMIRGGPNPENAKRLIDFILSKEVEERLAASASAQMPVRKSVPRPEYVKSAEELVTMDVDWEKVAEAEEEANGWLEDHRND